MTNQESDGLFFSKNGEQVYIHPHGDLVTKEDLEDFFANMEPHVKVFLVAVELGIIKQILKQQS